MRHFPIALLGLAAALSAACESDVANTHGILDPMAQQERFEAYSATKIFPDGKAMRHPPAGTVPFGHAEEIELEFAAGIPVNLDPGEIPGYPDPAGDIERQAGRQDGHGHTHGELPLEIDRALLERGRNRFAVYCSVCHGQLGDGQSVVAENMALRPPPSFHTERLREAPPSHFYTVATQGYGLMPALASQVSPRDRWAIAAYVKVLQFSQWAPLDVVPPGIREELLAAPPLPELDLTPPEDERQPGGVGPQDIHRGAPPAPLGPPERRGER